MNIPVYDIKGKSAEAWKIEDKIFGSGNVALLSQAVRIYVSNSHQKTSKVKTRGEVQGSTRKIYRQKGTGNARHGAKYAPIFVGGGIAHGPKGVRPENMILPKTMRRAALAAAMQAKLAGKAIAGLTGVDKFDGKTAGVVTLLATVANHPKNSVLIVTEDKATAMYQGIANLQGVTMKRASLVNAYDLVAAGHLVLTKDALETIKSRSIAKRSKTGDTL